MAPKPNSSFLPPDCSVAHADVCATTLASRLLSNVSRLAAAAAAAAIMISISRPTAQEQRIARFRDAIVAMSLGAAAAAASRYSVSGKGKERRWRSALIDACPPSLISQSQAPFPTISSPTEASLESE